MDGYVVCFMKKSKKKFHQNNAKTMTPIKNSGLEYNYNKLDFLSEYKQFLDFLYPCEKKYYLFYFA